MNDVEIEIQVRVSDKAKLERFLHDNATYKGESYQKDEYFTPVHRHFVSIKPVAEWLRLRESDKNSITYKKWHYDMNGKGDYCDEYETSIDNADQMRKVFKALDIKPVITVQKKRHTWQYNDYEVALDHVVGLGDFVEIEYKGRTNVNPKDITNGMIVFLKDIGCGKIRRNYMGYPYMLLFPDEVKFETV